MEFTKLFKFLLWCMDDTNQNISTLIYIYVVALMKWSIDTFTKEMSLLSKIIGELHNSKIWQMVMWTPKELRKSMSNWVHQVCVRKDIPECP
jgi:hypothetical protein